jgi:uncharacterized protein with HEPN domain
MRNRIVHGYDHLDPEIVWRVATEDVEPVLAALERIVEAGGPFSILTLHLGRSL